MPLNVVYNHIKIQILLKANIIYHFSKHSNNISNNY